MQADAAELIAALTVSHDGFRRGQVQAVDARLKKEGDGRKSDRLVTDLRLRHGLASVFEFDRPGSCAAEDEFEMHGYGPVERIEIHHADGPCDQCTAEPFDVSTCAYQPSPKVSVEPSGNSGLETAVKITATWPFPPSMT